MRLEKNTRTIFTPLDNGTGVLLNLESLFYYSLNKTAAALWQEIEQSTQTIESLTTTMCKRFEVDEEGARQGINAFVSRLAELKMIRVV